jgi:DNA-directed RNA polymerase specialized sigma24 family protein
MVFEDLARKASAVARHPALPAWLHRCTHYTVFNLRRKEARQLAALQGYAAETSSPASELDWGVVRPVLDDALNHLPAADRTAVILRFFSRHSFAEVAVALGLSGRAASASRLLPRFDPTDPITGPRSGPSSRRARARAWGGPFSDGTAGHR